MGWFEGFPFTSKEERERKKKEFENRVAPYGVDEQRKVLTTVLQELFPKIDIRSSLFVFYDAKDSYIVNEMGDEGRAAAMARMKKSKWLSDRDKKVFLTLIEMESEIDSLEDFPTAEEVMQRVYPDRDE